MGPVSERRRRGAAESLASIVLGFEALIVFLAGLVLYGLDGALPDSVPRWWGIVGGVVLAVLMVITAGVTKYAWGIWLGWLWQVVLALGGLLEPTLAVAALIFAAMYAFATIKGRQLDNRNAQLAAQTAPTNGETHGN